MMEKKDFAEVYEQTLMQIEDALESSVEIEDSDLDYETINDILTITCDDGSCIIVTKQSALSQLWVAAKSGGFHFDYHVGRDGERTVWLCDRNGEELTDFLARLLKEQANIEFTF